MIVTTCEAPGSAVPVAVVAATVVVPAPSGSRATPPPATAKDEIFSPGSTLTVRDCPLPAVVVSCAAAAVLFVTVKISVVPPGRTF